MKKFLVILFMTALAVSCSNDDDSPTAAKLNGSWKMNFFNPGPYSFEEGEITWTFSENGKKLQIVNNLQELPEGMPVSGSYDTSISGDSITINETTFYYGLGEVSMVVTIGEPDAPSMLFSRLYPDGE